MDKTIVKIIDNQERFEEAVLKDLKDFYIRQTRMAWFVVVMAFCTIIFGLYLIWHLTGHMPHE